MPRVSSPSFRKETELSRASTLPAFIRGFCRDATTVSCKRRVSRSIPISSVFWSKVRVSVS